MGCQVSAKMATGKSMKIFLLSIFCFLSAFFLFGQGETNLWYFGYNAGLDFSSGSPVALTNGQLNASEGAATVSDAAGSLLFYTDGTTIWDRTHTPMPNGSGLLGNTMRTATQAAIIIQKPGSVTIYYVFTNESCGWTQGLRYSEVDMTLNGGLGDITVNKNILLNTASTTEKLTAIRHCNNKDVWVISRYFNGVPGYSSIPQFGAYLVTSAGVNTTAVISSIGSAGYNCTGQMKGSPDGKKLAAALYNDSRIELYDFNGLTGIVSNPLLFPVVPGVNYQLYGVEFSPDGTKLYASTYPMPSIYQYDLCAGSNAAITASGVLVGTPASASSPGSLQLGPDKKIY